MRTETVLDCRPTDIVLETSLDDDEAVAVALSLRTAASHSVSGGEACVRALAKLEQVLPARLRERASTINQATVPLTGPAPDVDAGVLTTIAHACRHCERLEFGYRRHDGEQTARRVEPHRLVQAGYRWYLVARDLDRSDWRTFRADRIDAPAGCSGPRRVTSRLTGVPIARPRSRTPARREHAGSLRTRPSRRRPQPRSARRR
jgi:predicted DNA-binding transcriptional regulator YafY